MKKVIGLMIGLFPVSAYAQCITPPDCTSIGYTKTSCDGDSLKCPFDTTKLYCPPCDSSFKYSCTGDNIKNPVGNACNNKYAHCECIAGATYSNGECICDTSCDTIGNIYYSDGTCSSCYHTDRTPIGIIAYKDETKHLIINPNSISITWSADQKDNDGNVTLAWNVDIENLPNFDSSTKLTDWNGFENTQIIVNTYGENANGVAAVYCYNYTPVGLESSKGQWYLPAFAELYNSIYLNKNKIDARLKILGAPVIQSKYHWSSTEGGSTGAYILVPSTGDNWNSIKYAGPNTYCMLKI